MFCTAETTIAAIRKVAATIAEHREELIELDRAIGDADHGENLNRGFTTVLASLEGKVLETPGAVLKLVATTLISQVGGAAGPLYGTGFLRAATSLDDQSEVDAEKVVAALRAALEGVQARGKASVGDATMVDALAPAVLAAQSAVDQGSGLADALFAAAQAADQGAESTVDLVAHKGRASYLGERAIGHMDPGARSTALVLRAFAQAASE